MGNQAHDRCPAGTLGEVAGRAAEVSRSRANGPAIISLLQRSVPGILALSPKDSKEARCSAVAPAIEAGNVKVPDPRYIVGAEWVEEFLLEFSRFPRGRNDDQVDAATQALAHLVPAAGYAAEPWAVSPRAPRYGTEQVRASNLPNARWANPFGASNLPTRAGQAPGEPATCPENPRPIFAQSPPERRPRPHIFSRRKRHDTTRSSQDRRARDRALADRRPIPYEANPRVCPAEAVAKVAASLAEFGFRQAIVVDAEGVVVVGHTRLAAAKQLGLKEVPVHVAADLFRSAGRRHRIADNPHERGDLLGERAAAQRDRQAHRARLRPRGARL